jgi:glutamate-1-semialdehyde 2,1-aminomutase
MSAIRLARAFTGRSKVLKFAGCYHGHSDGLLARAGSGVATLAIPDSEGVPSSYIQNTLVAKYNDTHAVREIFKHNPEEIAAIIVEPIAANMGVVQPEPGFLEGLRGLADEFGALLIFDEVITGFRVDYGGAQALYNVLPDLTCLGKIIGGGLPIGAYGGKRAIMQRMAPIGGVYQAGTLSGNPAVMTAGIETLRLLNQKNVYEQLEERSSLLEKGTIEAAEKTGANVLVSRVGSILTIFFTDTPVSDYASAQKANIKIFSKFFQEMLDRGIYFPPSQFEATFVSLAHTEADIQKTCDCINEAFDVLSSQPRRE